MVTQTSWCPTTTTIMCKTADQCGQMDLDRLLLLLCLIALWLTWNDVKNLLCGQEPHNDITSPHHTASNVRMLTLHFAFTRILFLCVYRTNPTFNSYYLQHLLFKWLSYVKLNFRMRIDHSASLINISCFEECTNWYFYFVTLCHVMPCHAMSCHDMFCFIYMFIISKSSRWHIW